MAQFDQTKYIDPDYAKSAYEGLVSKQFTPEKAIEKMKYLETEVKPKKKTAEVLAAELTSQNIPRSQWSDIFAQEGVDMFNYISTVSPVSGSTTPTTTTTSEIPKTDAIYDEQNAIIDQQIADMESSKTKLDAELATIDSEMHPIIQDIKTKYDGLISQMEIYNKGAVGNVQTSQFRTGRARYASTLAEGNVKSALDQGLARISDLNAQMAQEVNLAKDALTSKAENRWKNLNDYMNNVAELRKEKTQALLDMQQRAKDEEDRAIALQKATLDLQRMEREDEEATAESVAGSLYASLGDDIDANMEYIIETAKDYGIDPNVLVGQINAYAQQDQENSLALTKTMLDLGAKIEEGQTMEVSPGVFVTGTKKKDELWIESIIGNTKYKDLYVKEGGEYVKKQRLDMGQAYKISGGGGGGGTTPKDEPLSINKIEQFRRSYGWTPPYGFTEPQLLKFMEDNPNATPEELEAGAKQALVGSEEMTEAVETSDRTSVEGLKERLLMAQGQGYSDDEIKTFIKQNYTTQELKQLADESGFSKWYTGKDTDIERMLDNLL